MNRDLRPYLDPRLAPTMAAMPADIWTLAAASAALVAALAVAIAAGTMMARLFFDAAREPGEDRTPSGEPRDTDKTSVPRA